MTVLRVLIIDDSITIRAMVDQIIQHEPGCGVVGVAADVAEARDLLTRVRPNLITLDLAMPGIDGLAFLESLKGTVHAPIIVVSSTTGDGTAASADAIERGAAACFDKCRIVADARRFLALMKDVAGRKPIRRAKASASV